MERFNLFLRLKWSRIGDLYFLDNGRITRGLRPNSGSLPRVTRQPPEVKSTNIKRALAPNIRLGSRLVPVGLWPLETLGTGLIVPPAVFRSHRDGALE
jgi:hypothetical protein